MPVSTRPLRHPANGRDQNYRTLPRDDVVTRSVWLAGAGIVAVVIGFAKTIEPLIELGAALVVVGWLGKPKR